MVTIEDGSSIVRFYISSQKKNYQLTLVPDTDYTNTYNFYSSTETLSETEVSMLLDELTSFIPLNHYVSCTGSLSPSTISLFKLLSFHTSAFKDTSCVKIAINSQTNERVALPILKRI